MTEHEQKCCHEVRIQTGSKLMENAPVKLTNMKSFTQKVASVFNLDSKRKKEEKKTKQEEEMKKEMKNQKKSASMYLHGTQRKRNVAYFLWWTAWCCEIGSLTSLDAPE